MSSPSKHILNQSTCVWTMEKGYVYTTSAFIICTYAPRVGNGMQCCRSSTFIFGSSRSNVLFHYICLVCFATDRMKWALKPSLQNKYYLFVYRKLWTFITHRHRLYINNTLIHCMLTASEHTHTQNINKYWSHFEYFMNMPETVNNKRNAFDLIVKSY